MKKGAVDRAASDEGGAGSPHGAADFLPASPSLPAARTAAADCRGCGLYRRATQAVFGEGADDAKVMVVGETPGDREDVVGRPFVGPAGQLLDRALAAAGMPREIGACLPWSHREIELVRPKVIVCLGATAGQALFGSTFSVTRERGRLLPSRFAPFVFATLHPSALLRIRESDARRTAFERFVADLGLVRTALHGQPSP